jgi:hypothetical protein
MTSVVFLAGLKAPRRQTNIRPDAGGFCEALRIVDNTDIGQSDQAPTPGTVMSRFTAWSTQAIVIRRRLRMAIWLLRASQANRSASATSCNGPPQQEPERVLRMVDRCPCRQGVQMASARHGLGWQDRLACAPAAHGSCAACGSSGCPRFDRNLAIPARSHNLRQAASVMDFFICNDRAALA